MLRETWIEPACHFQSILHIRGEVAGVQGEQCSLRVAGRNCKQTVQLEPVWPSVSHLGKQAHFRVPWVSHKQNNCLVRIQIKTPLSAPLLMSRQSRKTNLFGYLPPLVWFRGLSLSEVHIIDAGLCPLPFPFSFLLKHSVWWHPWKDKSLWTTALFQGCACFAAFPRESFMTAEWTNERTSPLSFGCQDTPPHTHPRADNWLQATLSWSRS